MTPCRNPVPQPYNPFLVPPQQCQWPHVDPDIGIPRAEPTIPRCNPPHTHNPLVRPDNVYGQRNPVDIEQDIAREQEWTRTVLG